MTFVVAAIEQRKTRRYVENVQTMECPFRDEGQQTALESGVDRVDDSRLLESCPWNDSGERVGQLLIN